MPYTGMGIRYALSKGSWYVRNVEVIKFFLVICFRIVVKNLFGVSGINLDN